MSNVLVYLEHAGAHVRSESLPAITFGKLAAQKLGGQLYFLLIGAEAKTAATAAATLGAAGVIIVEDSALGSVLAETYAPIIARIAKEKGAAIVGGAATNVGK